MGALAKSLLMAAGANALSLSFCAWAFGSHFNITIGWLFVAVVLFTVLAVILRVAMSALFPKFARGSTILAGLVLTGAALGLTDAAVPEDGFDIKGWWTLAAITLLVWAAGVAYGEVDKQAPADAPPVLPRA